jgi:CHAT domain-containing protein
MHYLKNNLKLLVILVTTVSVIHVTNLSFPTSASAKFPVADSSSQVDEKQTSPSLPIQSRVQEAKTLFNQGYQQYQQNRYSEAEKSLRSALETLNGGSRMRGFQAPRTNNTFGLTRINLNMSLDEAYVRIINNLSQGNNLYEVASDISDSAFKIVLGCMSGKRECDEITRGENRTPTNNPPQNAINSVEDGHKIEMKILRLIQRVLIAQNQQDKTQEALEVAQESHNLELFRTVPAALYALNNEVLQGEITNNNLPRLITPKNLSIKEIRNINKENFTLVYYSTVSQEEIFIWVVQPNGKIGFKKVNLSSLNTSIEETTRNALRVASSYIDRGLQGKSVRQAIRDFKLQTNNTDSNPDVSETEQKQNLQKLYQILIEPIKELLPTDPTKHVVLIPQSSLLLVPFYALQDDSGQYLIEKHTIRIAPNLQNLQKRSSLKQFPRGDEMLVVGNPTYQGMSELPGAKNEAIAIAGLSGTHPLIGNQAHAKAISQRIFNAKILHFATHGILDAPNSTSLNDVILLITSTKEYTNVTRMVGVPSPNKENHRLWYSIWFDKDRNTTGHLIRTNGSLPGAIVLTNYLFTSQEILNLKLKADLVVLSACNTAQGIPGDSIVLGLPLSLGLAGVPRVVLSLWGVPDPPTQILMFEFYAAMRKQNREGKEIDEAQALREAMLKVKNMEQYRDPINWAGFTLMDVSYRTKN